MLRKQVFNKLIFMRVRLAGLALMGIFCNYRILSSLVIPKILYYTRIEMVNRGAAICNLCILLSGSKYTIVSFINGKVLFG